MELDVKQKQKLKLIIHKHSNNYVHFLHLYDDISKFLQEELKPKNSIKKEVIMLMQQMLK
ncbi:hypothetical protein K9L97_00875 [Candidatus Woesearchaeota archaeon]|nr:hypothetical protein [Candidatus Woesearchaeota archaeon]